MAMNSMNYSSCTVHAADDAMRRGGGADWNYDTRYMYGGAAESSGSGSGSDDILALLPSDPFGMEELSNSLSAAIFGWIGDLDDDIDADLDYYWNQALAYSSSEHSDCSWVETEIPGLLLPCMDDLPGWFCGSWVWEGFQGVAGAPSSSSVTVRDGEEAECSGGGVDLPLEALIFALNYLDPKDLLSVEMVCKTLRATVQSDPLLWRRIHVDSPLDKRITDDDLLRLTRKAQGSLESLNLRDCTNITDEGLKNVLVSNPKLKKLGIDGCLRVTVAGLICNLRIFNSLAVSRINYLKLGSCFSLSPEQFEELRSLVDGEELARRHQPSYYHEVVSCVRLGDEDRWMDIGFCPMCQQHKLVFDCPLESCRSKKIELCRGCVSCIHRCYQCGRCIDNCVYTETFCLRFVCGDCWKNVPLTAKPREE